VNGSGSQTGRVRYSQPVTPGIPVVVELASFQGDSGVEEAHLTALPTQDAEFSVQLDWLRCAVEAAGLDSGSAVLRRFFCDDLPRQAPLLSACPFSNGADGAGVFAASWVGQAPTAPARIALWAYHIRDPRGGLQKTRHSGNLMLARGQLTHCWTVGMTAVDRQPVADETRAVFEAYEGWLRQRRMSLADHTVRTWVYLRDIDRDYGEMAAARRSFFAERGLTPQTHYIASTGIQGRSAVPAARVMLDAYAVGGLGPGQLEYLRAPDWLSPTDLYGVTFERAVAVRYQDRKQVFLSGTASIDAHGRVVHPGSLERQTERTLDNLAALLEKAGAVGADLCVLVAYLRQPEGEPLVRRAVRRRFGDVPTLVVIAPICRTEWLVEIEGQALAAARAAEHPAL